MSGNMMSNAYPSGGHQLRQSFYHLRYITFFMAQIKFQFSLNPLADCIYCLVYVFHWFVPLFCLVF